MASEKSRILFVDDEPRVMYGLRYMLHTMNKKWDMEFVTGSKAALEVMEKRPYDLIVADMLMPEMYGGDLLEEIRKKHAGVVRFILSGYSNKEMIIRSFGATHQYLAKPCNAEILKGMVAQVLYLQEQLPDESLRTAVLDMKALPTLAEREDALLKALDTDGIAIEEVAEIIGSDVAMTAVVLHFVNSAFFGLRHKIENIEHAVTTLGIETIRDMFTKGEILDRLAPEQAEAFGVANLYTHSCNVSARAGRIMQSLSENQALTNEAVMAGMLHAIGILILVAVREGYAEIFEKYRSGQTSLAEAEAEMLGTSYAKVGGYLLGIWGLPEGIVDAVYHHLTPSECANATLSPLTAVHVANILEMERLLGPDSPVLPPLDMDYLQKVGAQDMLEKWREDA